MRAGTSGPAFTAAFNGEQSPLTLINIPATTSATNGVIQMAGTPILSAKGSENIFLGSGAGNFTFTGSENTGVGALAMNLMTAGNHNSGLGDAALYAEFRL